MPRSLSAKPFSPTTESPPGINRICTAFGQQKQQREPAYSNCVIDNDRVFCYALRMKAASNSDTEPAGDYAVGYGKPLRHTGFQKSRSGNPKGRPKGSKNLATLLAEALDEKVQVTEGVAGSPSASW